MKRRRTVSFGDLFLALKNAGFPNITQRQAHFDLSDLVGLEIIEHDKSSKMYRAIPTNLKEWTEGDLKKATEHSRKLMLDEDDNPLS